MPWAAGEFGVVLRMGIIPLSTFILLYAEHLKGSAAFSYEKSQAFWHRHLETNMPKQDVPAWAQLFKNNHLFAGNVAAVSFQHHTPAQACVKGLLLGASKFGETKSIWRPAIVYIPK